MLSRLKQRALDSLLYGYRHVYMPVKGKQLRRKKVIKVVFLISTLGSWKTESLYCRMKQHPGFDPLIMIYNNRVPGAEDSRKQIADYCESKGYGYKVIDAGSESCYKYSHADIIFFQQPYEPTHLFRHNLKALFCYVHYGFWDILDEWAWNLPLLKNCWQIYYETEESLKLFESLSGHDIKNQFLTGFPIMDDIMNMKFHFKDPWLKTESRDLRRKKIIYAPHHSINSENPFQSSTFLETGELMLELAEKYSDKVQWAFKPHPGLHPKLLKVWGKEKTDDYYDRWNNLEWSQIERGQYIGLFRYSDALIHDCISFTIEYMLNNKPALYLRGSGSMPGGHTPIFNEALNLHKFGYNSTDIENFIISVINGQDDMKQQRSQFIQRCGSALHCRTASENIIECILGKS